MRVEYACLTACALILCATHTECNQPELPESTLRPIDHNTTSTSTSTCFGLNNHFQPSCPASGTVIAIRELTVGSKLNLAGCPGAVRESMNGGLEDHSGNPVDQSCCRKETGDCTFEYLSHDQNNSPFKHFRYCTGLNTCSKPAETIRDNTQSACNSSYMGQTSYMYAQYYCINETRIADMCSSSVSKTISGSAFYLESPNYPNNITYGGNTNCACSVQSSVCQDTIDVYTVHVEMMSDGATCKQRLTVNDSDSGTILEWDCNSQTMFNITVTSTGNYITVELENDLTSDGGYAWLGFKGNLDNADLVINCPPVPENCTNAPTTTGAQSGDEGGVPLGAIIGAILGLLLLVAVLVACCCYCKKKKKKKKKNQVDHEDEKDPDEKKPDDSLRFRTCDSSAAPVNTQFPVGGAASLRGLETRYIMKHSDVNGIEQDNDDAKKPPARLPPITPGSTHPPPNHRPPPIGLVAPPIIPPPSKNGAPRIITKPSADHPPPDYQTQSPKDRPPAVFHPDKVGEDDFVNERSITSRDIHLQPSIPVSNGDGDDGQKTKKKKHRKHKKKSKAQAAERSDDAGGEMQQTDDQDDVAHTQLSEGQSVDESNA